MTQLICTFFASRTVFYERFCLQTLSGFEKNHRSSCLCSCKYRVSGQ